MKKQILVIDDDMPMLCLLRSMLSSKYEVTCRENGLEACDWLSEGNFPDLIVSDLCMPVMDGHELLKVLRASGLYRNIPVIILSTLHDTQTIKRCLNEGAIACLNKPFEAELLTGVINRSLSHGNPQRLINENIVTSKISLLNTQ